MREFGITIRSTYTVIDDTELDRLVSKQWLLRGHLASIGYRVQQSRIRDPLRRVDPLGVMSRWILGIHRRIYSVPESNALWHVDGNHKMIRYYIILITINTEL